MEMEKKLLSYNLSPDFMEKLNKLCLQENVVLLSVSDLEYDVPLGFLAYGSPEQKQEFLRSESTGKAGVDDPMLVFAGFMRDDLMSFLQQMKQTGLNRVDLKAMLTEHNAVWNSSMLFEEIKKEHEYMKNMNQS